jgi:hypothetical protein
VREPREPRELREPGDRELRHRWHRVTRRVPLRGVRDAPVTEAEPTAETTLGGDDVGTRRTWFRNGEKAGPGGGAARVGASDSRPRPTAPGFETCGAQRGDAGFRPALGTTDPVVTNGIASCGAAEGARPTRVRKKPAPVRGSPRRARRVPVENDRWPIGEHQSNRSGTVAEEFATQQ